MGGRSESGFSLIDILLVVAAGAVLASVAIPQIDGALNSYRLTNSAQGMTSELNMARVLAVSRNATFELQVNQANGSYQITDPEDPQNPPRSLKRLEPGISFSTVPANNIAFYSRGRARGGTIQLQDALGRVYTIQVEPTGKVQVN